MCATGRGLGRSGALAVVPGRARLCQVVTAAIAQFVAHSGSRGRREGTARSARTGRGSRDAQRFVRRDAQRHPHRNAVAQHHLKAAEGLGRRRLTRHDLDRHQGGSRPARAPAAASSSQAPPTSRDRAAPRTRVPGAGSLPARAKQIAPRLAATRHSNDRDARHRGKQMGSTECLRLPRQAQHALASPCDGVLDARRAHRHCSIRAMLGPPPMGPVPEAHGGLHPSATRRHRRVFKGRQLLRERTETDAETQATDRRGRSRAHAW